MTKTNTTQTPSIKKTYCARTHRAMGDPSSLHICTGGSTCKGGCKPKAVR